MTYGQVRFRVSKEVPGLDLDLLDGYLVDRYTSILDRLKWNRQRSEYTFSTVAPYATGTLALTQGSNVVTLTGGTFTSGMTGRRLLVGGQNEPYTFTYVGAAAGTLDRGFDGATASGLSYQIVQPFYALPATARLLDGGRLLDTDEPLANMSRAELNASAPARIAVGVPGILAPAIDSSSNLLQVEVYPAPDAIYSVAAEITSEAPSITGTATTLLPWLRPSALVAGASADAFAHKTDWNSAKYAESKYESYLSDMIRTEGFNRGPRPVKLAGWMTRHNVERAMRSSQRTGPRLP